MTSHLAVGFRFERRDAPKLRLLARCTRGGGEILDKAADAAAVGEPLIVICSDEAEANRLAYDFSRWGVQRPVIEQLSGAPRG